MVELLTYIASKLKEVHPRVYLGDVLPTEDPVTQKKPEFPYVTYYLPNSLENELREDFILEVDIWDNNSNTATLETLTDNIDKAINRLRYHNDKIQVRFYRTNRLMIPDQDKSIRRRQLRYDCQTYFLK